MLLMRLKRLYQIPDFTEVHSVDLAEWIIGNYKWEEGATIESCLNNPPATETEKTNWRLTPDTIRTWMAVAIDRVAEKREREVQQLKNKEKEIEQLDKVDYEAFKKRTSNGPIPNEFNEQRLKKWSNDTDYQDFKNKILQERFKKLNSGEAAS